jgi:hypothetical protein
VLLRVLALLAAIVIPLLCGVEAISQLHPVMFWVGPLAAIACALPIARAATNNRTQALLGAALAAMAAASTPDLPELWRITADEASLRVHDLRDAPLPSDAEGYVAVRGYLLDEWVVDEYFPKPGERPNENEAPAAVLLPLLGTDANELHAEQLGRVIVARVKPERVAAPIVTLRGKLGPVNPEIVDSLFIVQVQGQSGGPPPRPDAVLLDTLDVPTRARAWTRIGLAIGAAFAGLLLLWFSLPGREPRGERRG